MFLSLQLRIESTVGPEKSLCMAAFHHLIAQYFFRTVRRLEGETEA